MRIANLYDDPETKALLFKVENDDEQKISSLTNAQRAVLPLICDGLLNKQAANALGISQRTIENHRTEIMRKTGCKTFAQLVRLYARAG